MIICYTAEYEKNINIRALSVLLCIILDDKITLKKSRWLKEGQVIEMTLIITRPPSYRHRRISAEFLSQPKIRRKFFGGRNFPPNFFSGLVEKNPASRIYNWQVWLIRPTRSESRNNIVYYKQHYIINAFCCNHCFQM